jgi:hypothetical protein
MTGNELEEWLAGFSDRTRFGVRLPVAASQAAGGPGMQARRLTSVG